MFLRKTSRFKDGKVHDDWSVAENSRAGRRVVQRQLLYLGEIGKTVFVFRLSPVAGSV